MFSRKRDKIDAYLFLLPSFLGLLLFKWYPNISSLALSFTEWNGFTKINFIGLQNFQKLFHYDTFLIALKNTAFFALGVVPGQLILALIVAQLLNTKIRGQKFYRVVFFMPYISALVSVAIVWSVLLHPTFGPINLFLKHIGFSNPPAWLSDTRWALPSIIGMSIWKSFGYFSVIFLAGLQGIPEFLYEAATIDGASSFQKFTKITLPLLTPSIFYSLIVATIGSFKVFDQVYIMTEGGPGRATTTLVQFIYEKAFTDFRLGYASAAAMVLFIITLALTFIQKSTEKRWVNYGA